jgi:chorismate dehydratase
MNMSLLKSSFDSMPKLRISAISYLNTAPLMWDFEHGVAGSSFDISYTIPSRCAASLREGSADIGIIPAAAYVAIPDLLILPDVAIASRQAVRSILLVSKVPLADIQTVALDISSLTSVALTKVLFAKWWGGARTYAPMEPDIERMLNINDAGLLIGDPALKIERSRYKTYDLAEEWIHLTGCPFVFAFWAVRLAALRETGCDLDLPRTFQDSRDHGLTSESLRQIAGEWSPRLGLSEADVKSYLTENIYYHLDRDCLEGLQLFYDYARECAALPPAPALHFLEAPGIVASQLLA